MEILLNNCQVQIGVAPNGLKILQFLDPNSKIVVTVPLTLEAARSIGAALSTGLVIASGPLKTDSAGGNGH